MTMVERIARAVCREDHVSLYGAYYSWRSGELDAKVDRHWSKHIQAAKAVLRDMREPTERMAEWGGCSEDYGGTMIGQRAAENAWRSMVDKAVEEASQIDTGDSA